MKNWIRTCVEDRKLKENVALMRGLQSRVKLLAANCENAGIKKLADALRYSDPVSSPSLRNVEQELSDLIDQLQAAVESGDAPMIDAACGKACAVLAERNRLCKLNKHKDLEE